MEQTPTRDRRRIRLGVPRDGPTAPLAQFVEAARSHSLRPWFQAAATLRIYHAAGLVRMDAPPNLSALALTNTVPLRLELTDEDITSRLLLETLDSLSHHARQIWLLEAGMQLLALERSVGQVHVTQMLSQQADRAAGTRRKPRAAPVRPAPPTPRATSPPPVSPPPASEQPSAADTANYTSEEGLEEETRASLRAMVG